MNSSSTLWRFLKSSLLLIRKQIPLQVSIPLAMGVTGLFLAHWWMVHRYGRHPTVVHKVDEFGTCC